MTKSKQFYSSGIVDPVYEEHIHKWVDKIFEHDFNIARFKIRVGAYCDTCDCPEKICDCRDKNPKQGNSYYKAVEIRIEENFATGSTCHIGLIHEDIPTTRKNIKNFIEFLKKVDAEIAM